MQQLYRVIAKVDLLPAHPQYYEFERGYLNVWLYAPDAERARRNAFEIVKLAQCQPTSSQAHVIRVERPSDLPVFEAQAQTARQMGLAVLLVAQPLGAEPFENDGF